MKFELKRIPRGQSSGKGFFISTFRFDLPLAQAVEKISLAHGLSMSSVVNQVLQCFVDSVEVPDNIAPVKTAKPTTWNVGDKVAEPIKLKKRDVADKPKVVAEKPKKAKPAAVPPVVKRKPGRPKKVVEAPVVKAEEPVAPKGKVKITDVDESSDELDALNTDDLELASNKKAAADVLAGLKKKDVAADAPDTD